MKPLATVRSLALAAMLVPALAHSQYDVPVWYVDYEVTIKANHTAATRGYGGQPASTTWVFERVFSASTKLDMRNEGSVIGTTQAALSDPDKFKNMTQAEMMRYSQDMQEAMQYTANWMPGPLDVGDAPDAMMSHVKSVAVPVRFQYQSTITGKDLVDELGGKFDGIWTKTGSLSGGKLYLGDQYKFEINTQSKQYWLALPYTGQDVDPLTRALKWESVEKTRPAGSSTWEEQRSSADAEIDWLPGSLRIDTTGETMMGDVPLIVGTLAGPDKITGEKTFKASFPDSQVDVPVTITFKYTLSSTPPATKQ